jgi:lipid A 3-O-deacylase
METIRSKLLPAGARPISVSVAGLLVQLASLSADATAYIDLEDAGVRSAMQTERIAPRELLAWADAGSRRVAVAASGHARAGASSLANQTPARDPVAGSGRPLGARAAPEPRPASLRPAGGEFDAAGRWAGRLDLPPTPLIYLEYGNEDKGAFQRVSESAFGDDRSDGSFSQSFLLSASWRRGLHEHVSVSLEQHVFTPSGENKRSPTAVDGDRPFAAYFGGGFGFTRLTGRWIHRLDLRLGVVGKMAGGDDVQSALHRVGDKAATVWDDQVTDRMGAVVEYRPTVRWLTRCRSACAEFALQGALVGGNLLTYQGLGATLRLGTRLDRDFGPPVFSQFAKGPSANDARRWGWSVFAGEERRHVHRNYLLEGPAARTGRHTVVMSTYPSDRHFGADLRIDKTTVSLVLVRRAPEFMGQPPQQFVRVGIGASY